MSKQDGNAIAAKSILSVALASAFLYGCGDDNNTDAKGSSGNTYTLQLLHVADMDGSNARVIDNAGNFAKNIDALTKQYPDNTLFVSSGDNYIPGARYDASADTSFSNVAGVNVPGVGRGDIAFLNAMGVAASAVGNHDMDGGPAEFASIINVDNAYPGAQFPYLSANLDFTKDVNTQDLVASAGQMVSDLSNKLAASAVVEVNGEKIGLVGATTPTQDVITSTGDVEVLPQDKSLEGLAAIIQTEVDALTRQGINKIIVLAHMQSIEVEKSLAPLLSGVDIIVAGGSNTLLANDNDELWPGDTAADAYPLHFTSASDEPVLVVNVDGDFKYLGRLVVEFDESGVINTNGISDKSGVVLSSDEMALTLGGEANTDVDNIAAKMNDVIVASESVILGNSSVFLNGVRAHVRSEETNLGNLTADANLWYAQQEYGATQISIKNGGGIRAEIGQAVYPAGSTDPSDLQYLPTAAFPSAGKEAGDISQFDIQTALAFNNDLVVLDVTAAELKTVLEHSFGGVDATGYGGGRFPQLAGLEVMFDATKTAREVDENGVEITAGERVRTLKVGDDILVKDGMIQGDTTRSFKVVTLGYIATGGDGYPFPCVEVSGRCSNQQALADMSKDPSASNFAETGSEQDALAEFLLATYPDAAHSYSMSDNLFDASHTDARIVSAE